MNMSQNQLRATMFGERNLNFSAFAQTTPATASTASSFTDVLGGLVSAFTPAAQAAVTTAISPNQTSLMSEYLQGKLPGYTINSAGQLVPVSTASSSNWILPVVLVGGVVAVFLMMHH